MKRREIKAILFDSGRVLNSPATGHWFITPNFWKYVDKEKFDSLDSKKISAAFREAERHISAQKTILTKEAEYESFVDFYQKFAECVPELEIGQVQVEALANEIVNNPKKYIFYADALKVIPELKEKYKLSVVSDAWPSLKDVFAEQGLEKYFDSFVISSIIGETKPHEKMYITALEDLNVSPEEAVFIDDNLKNCQGAIKLGIQAVLLCRNKWLFLLNKVRSVGKGYRVIRTLEDLDKML